MSEPECREMFLCRCGHMGHTIKVSCFPGEQDGLYLGVCVYQYQSFWQRLWAGVKYIFTGHGAEFDETILCPNDAKRLQQFINDYFRSLSGER